MKTTASLNLLLATLVFAGAASAAGHEDDKTPAKPTAAQAAKHDGMAGMDHSKMAGMDHGNKTGTDHAAMGKAHFAKLDVNKDGFVTKAEVPKDMQAHFGMMDANKDGKLTEAELASMHHAK